MSNRNTSDNSSEVSLFPFLAVLLCTMGALLVLLVVMAQQVGKQVAVEEPRSEPAKPAPDLEPPSTAAESVEEPNSSDEAEELVRQLAEVHEYQAKLEENHKKHSQRLSEEQQRLSHLEEHGRRLEVELAKLSLASEQLKATENNQTVDQQRAEREQQQLQQQIQETEATLEEMQGQATGKKSYAIVPYKGPNGTFRRPIFVECSKAGIVLQPEGIRLIPEDFVRPLGPGNPLAAALRAAREYLNSKAAESGESVPPDPYPLIVVRPDGLAQYYFARSAVASWDADFGYVFVRQDLPLEFPAIDSQLAKVEHHAVMQARQMQQLLARAAPSRYRGRSLESNRPARASSGSQGYGGTRFGGAGGGDNRYGTLAGTASAGSGQTNGQLTGSSEEGSNSEAGTGFSGGTQGDYQLGADESENYGSAAGGTAPSGTDSQQGSADGSGKGQAEGGNCPDGQCSADSQFAQTTGESGSPDGSSSTPSSSGTSGTASSAMGTSAEKSAQSGSPSLSFNTSRNQSSEQSIAATQGTDWAVRRKAVGSVPMRRPIRVIIRKDRLAILPGQRLADSVEPEGSVIFLNQSSKTVSNELATALRDEIDEWGLAGNGLHWRPVLVLKVGPDAEQTAVRLMKLLRNSGVEIQSPEMARSKGGGHDRATR